MKQNLLFIHGFRGNHLGLEDVIKYFDRDKYNIYAPDIPPAGSNSMKSYTPETYAEFIANYIKSNGIKSPILIGHSMGSIVAAAVAENYPELINKKIIFISPISVKVASFFKALSPLSAVLPNHLISHVTTKYFFVSKDKDLYKKTIDLTMIGGADSTSKKDSYKSAKFSANYSILDFDLAGKDIHYIAGEKDRLVPKERTKNASKKLGGTITFIKDTGHLVNYEDPKATAAAIEDFINAK